MWTREAFRAVVPGGVIGMIHLPPLPGSPRWGGDMAAVTRAALEDAAALAGAGVGAVMVENYHDAPFHPEQVPPATVAALAVVAASVREAHEDLALGVNVLRNDAASALAVATAVGARFVRVNVHVGAAVADQGPLTGRAWHTLRLRRELGADVGILADLRVKHAAPLVARDLDAEARDLRLRGLADGVIVSGAATGAASDPDEFDAVRAVLPDCPLLVGSGATPATVGALLHVADACIVGTALQTAEPAAGRRRIDAARARAFVAAVSERKD